MPIMKWIIFSNYSNYNFVPPKKLLFMYIIHENYVVMIPFSVIMYIVKSFFGV